MRFIKEHKFTAFVIVLFIIAVIILFFIYNLFFSNSGKPEYGNRLDGIEQVEIKDSELKKIKENLKKNDNVIEVSTNVSGRTLDIVVTVNDKLSVSDAKKIGKNSYSDLSESQIKFYSVQVFIKKNDETKNNFPIIGYKQKNAKSLVWTKDRKVTSWNEAK